MAAATQRAPRVGDYCTYYYPTTRLPRPARVTSVAGTVVTLRIASSRQLIAGVPFRTAHNQTGVWAWTE